MNGCSFDANIHAKRLLTFKAITQRVQMKVLWINLKPLKEKSESATFHVKGLCKVKLWIHAFKEQVNDLKKLKK